MIPHPILGPSLTIDGQTAQWTGSGNNGLGRVGVSCRVPFEANTNERIVSLLNICNDGTTAIYYSWKVGIDCNLTVLSCITDQTMDDLNIVIESCNTIQYNIILN